MIETLFFTRSWILRFDGFMFYLMETILMGMDEASRALETPRLPTRHAMLAF